MLRTGLRAFTVSLSALLLVPGGCASPAEALLAADNVWRTRLGELQVGTATRAQAARLVGTPFKSFEQGRIAVHKLALYEYLDAYYPVNLRATMELRRTLGTSAVNLPPGTFVWFPSLKLEERIADTVQRGPLAPEGRAGAAEPVAHYTLFLAFDGAGVLRRHKFIRDDE